MSENRSEHETEQRLRGLFARMREEDLRDAPEFRVPVLETRRRSLWRGQVLPLAVAAALAAVAVLTTWSPVSDTGDSGIGLSEWSAPSTDFLGLGDDDTLDVDSLVAEFDVADGWTSLPSDEFLTQAEEMFTETEQLP